MKNTELHEIPKRRIRQNAWGNWYGYEGRKRVIAFTNTPYGSQEQYAEEWLARKETDPDSLALTSLWKFPLSRKVTHDSLQKANVDALSFYPKQVFERESAKGRIFLGLLNGEPCGYIYAGAIRPTVACHQVCIQYDARRRLYGAMLVVAVEQYALDGYAWGLRLRCGFDLEANDFWMSLGYKCVAVVDGGIRRQRKINIWRKQLVPALFEDVHIEPAKGKQDASLWRKHKQTGIVNQFYTRKEAKGLPEHIDRE